MIIVTGGAGFIGSALVWRLNEMGETQVLVSDRLRNGPKWRNLAKRQVTRILHSDELLDWLKRESAHVKIEAIFHMGACSSTVETDVDFLIANNLNYSVALWEYATANRVPFIYASSASTYGDGTAGFNDADAGSPKLVPMNPYGFSKHKFDAYALDQAKAKKTPPFWAGLKFFNVYGPNEYHKGSQSSVIHQFVPQVTDSGRIRLFKSYKAGVTDGEQKRDFVYVKDVVKVMTHLWKKQPESGVYNCGTGTARTFKDLAKAVFGAMNVPEKIDLVDAPDNIRRHYQYFTEANLSRLRKVAGYQDEFTSLEAGINEYVREYLLKDDRYL